MSLWLTLPTALPLVVLATPFSRRLDPESNGIRGLRYGSPSPITLRKYNRSLARGERHETVQSSSGTVSPYRQVVFRTHIPVHTGHSAAVIIDSSSEALNPFFYLSSREKERYSTGDALHDVVTIFIAPP